MYKNRDEHIIWMPEGRRLQLWRGKSNNSGAIRGIIRYNWIQIYINREGKMSIKEMIKNEVDKLPEGLLAEVFDFIQFLEIKRNKNIFAKASQELSTASFKKIWDNKEDAVYDSL
ncbi:MAG TPA: hypothetical protein DD725_11335 [Deltaproteobacteria bacterium]|nr:MAG: hypothetical protein A2Z89_03560 [Deltaproteobacteria bacterium GWA2_43_19]OGQ10798.1 MAG: hypothetical protein A3D30_08255 [Deltaproteobacteria bacterium RIFCSPHIGHO2_02_FULL_43_33]OGQ33779.1 MAG: hypothetical protein A3A85_00580 [Deltaproteobacteria bacterium RIFCSPLOWO2_01_FULL_42_9]HBR18175.1 hypothetical protein [Deltaproteobacteria bacterium]